MAAILLDTCVWGGVLPALIECGHNVIWSGTWDQDPGDREILETARSQNRILVTLDKDFGELAVLQDVAHSGIIRLAGFTTGQMADVIDHIVRTYHVDLNQGAIITANPKGIRIRIVTDL